MSERGRSKEEVEADSEEDEDEEEDGSGEGDDDDSEEDGSGDGEGDGSDDDEGSSDEESAAPVKKVLPSRTTRGARMTDIHKEGDDDFWGQEFFKDDPNADSDYESETEEEDIPDADFFDPEEASDEEEVEVEKETKRTRRGYKDPVAAKGRKGAAAANSSTAAPQVADTTAAAAANAAASEPPLPRGKGRKRAAADTLVSERRKSARASTVQRAAERDQAEHERSQKQKKVRPRVEPKILTQEERLKRAEINEVENKESLRKLLEIEEEKKRYSAKKAVTSGSAVIFISKNNRNYISFVRPEALPPLFDQKAPKEPKPQMCKITGNRAKYLDPALKVPFYNLMAYKQLHSKENKK